MEHFLRKLAFSFLAVILVGCGGGGGGSESPAQPTSQAGVAPTTGTIVVEQTLLRALPSSINRQRFTGFDSRGAVRFGPQSFSKAPTIELLSVGTAVTRLQIEYFQDDVLVGLGLVPVTVLAGETTRVSDPPFDDVNEVLESIVVAPIEATIATGTSIQYRASGNFFDGTQQDLTRSVNWTISSAAVASISDSGVARGVTPGVAVVSASLGSQVGKATLTVTPATITSIAVRPNAPTIADGTTQQFTAIATLTDNSTQDVTASVSWTSDTTSVATIDGDGLATSVDPGQTTITATVNGVSGETTLTVTPVEATIIQVTPTDSTIASGTSLQYTAVATFTDLSTQDVTGLASWVSSETSAATVDPNGLATARVPGATTISASFGGRIGQTTLTVTPATITSIAVTPNAPTIADGTIQQFTATATLTDNSTQDVTTNVSWSSNDITVATVDSDGLVSAVNPGQTLISATLGNVSGDTVVRVSPAFFTEIERISISSTGTEGNGASNIMELSANGNEVAFLSFSSNLDPVNADINGENDLYLRDRSEGTTELISRTSSRGAVGATNISISGDGRRLSFSSIQALVNGDSTITSMFVFDRASSNLLRFPPVSFGRNVASFEGQLSFDGSIASFASSTESLAPPDSNGVTGFDIFVYDQNTNSVDRVSQDGQGNSGNRGSSNADISSDGRFVTFTSGSTNLAPNDNNNQFDVFVFDRTERIVERVSVSSQGNEGNGNSLRSSISADGRFVAFESSASNLVPNDNNNQADIFVFDRETDQIERVSVNEQGEEANNLSSIPYFSSISNDGRFVVFSSLATNLVNDDTNGTYDVFAFDRLQRKIRRISISFEGKQGNGFSSYAQISEDGSTIAFTSSSNNLVVGDSNNRTDIFVVPNPFSR